MRPGIVSRGYGATARAAARRSAPTSDAARVGDEPLLLAQRSGCPVWIGADRAAAARALLARASRMRRDRERRRPAALRARARRRDRGDRRRARPRQRPHAARGAAARAGVAPARSRRRRHARRAARASTRAEARYRHDARRARVSQPAQSRVTSSGPSISSAGACTPSPASAIRARFFAHLEALGLAFEAHAFPDHHALHARRSRVRRRRRRS